MVVATRHHIQAGADPAAANACGLNAALAAASHGRLLEMRLLERHMGALAWQQLLACSKDKHGATPLHFAASSGEAHSLHVQQHFLV
jgi:ankyrin repeat protein